MFTSGLITVSYLFIFFYPFMSFSSADTRTLKNIHKLTQKNLYPRYRERARRRRRHPQNLRRERAPEQPCEPLRRHQVTDCLEGWKKK